MTVPRDGNPGGGGLAEFYTSTQKLNVWLDVANFRYNTEAYQRTYEWEEPQVLGLLNSVEEVLKEASSKTSPAVLKISEVVLLQRSPEEPGPLKDFTGRLNSKEWFLGRSQPCSVEIIDGQQRITTFCLIYAVLQQRLHDCLKCMAGGDGAGQGCQGARAEVAEEVNRIRKRLTWDAGKYVLLQRSRDGRAFFDSSTLTSDPDASRLAALLTSSAGNGGEGIRLSQEQENACSINDWFKARLEKGAAYTAEAQVAWLLQFQRTLDTQVMWTTTLTTYQHLALQTFVNYNLETSKVALALPDIIKVALVGGIDSEGKVSQALKAWEEAVKVIDDAAEYLTSSDAPAWLRMLSRATLPTSVADWKQLGVPGLKKCLLQEFTKCLCVIQEAKSGKVVLLSNSADEVVPHFLDLSSRAGWDGVAYMCDTLRPYARAFATMLTRRDCTSTAGGVWRDLDVSINYTLCNLLSLADPDWRPVALAIIQECSALNLSGKGCSLARDALIQLECAALQLAILKDTEKIRAHSARTAKAYGAALKSIFSLTDKSTGKCSDQPAKANHKGALLKATGGGQIQMMQDMYLGDVYRGKAEPARTLLLIAEHQERLPLSSKGGGYKAIERSGAEPPTVEHILPQKLKYAYWTGRFGAQGGPKHVALLHKLGNLALVSKDLNEELANKPFPIKMDEFRRQFPTELPWTIKKLGELAPVCSETGQSKDVGGGWDQEALLERHRQLVQTLASRYNVAVTAEQWDSWREELLSKFPQEPSAQAAGSAGGTGSAGRRFSVPGDAGSPTKPEQLAGKVAKPSVKAGAPSEEGVPTSTEKRHSERSPKNLKPLAPAPPNEAPMEHNQATAVPNAAPAMQFTEEEAAELARIFMPPPADWGNLGTAARNKVSSFKKKFPRWKAVNTAKLVKKMAAELAE